MKTKIIYISGNELFDMADIRAAFDEVRSALSLGSDTVLFGVPVDNDDALVATQPSPEVENEPIIDNISEPVIETTAEPIVTKKARKSAKVVPITQATKQENNITETVDNDAPGADEPVIPILSVLGSEQGQESAAAPETVQEIIEEPESITPESDVDIIHEDVNDAESVTISDMIADEVPEMPHEKTLEELLESMTPLGEEAEKANEPTKVEEGAESDTTTSHESDDTDITLEKLAAEFAESEDKIETPSRPATRGKIGKLKNILPFKKAKHEESGLMGDLFGWAGVAANDEDFTIPGFFK